MEVIDQLKKAYQNQKLSHAYLFEGDDAETMKTTAMDFAQFILCQDQAQCRNKVTEHNHPDFQYVMTDEATIKKEQVEALVHHMNQLPIEGDFKVYVIQDFEKLTVQGENSILKFLEEPPQKTIAVIMSTKPEQILDTIHSRCQHVYFKPMSRATFVSRLMAQDETITKPIAELLSTYTTQIEVATQLNQDFELQPFRKVLLQWCYRLVKQREMALIGVVELLKHAKNRQLQLMALSGINAYFQDLLYVKTKMSDRITFSGMTEEYESLASQMSYRHLTYIIEQITEAHKKLNQNVNPTLVFEQIAIKVKG
ncbi:DNA polymerase III subunit delta' C-terminal domain-containing protein [Staphylococcus schleiferi]|uniref:DNA polymerase III subunit delta' n=1 Tax=Staphylococcus schleiferi TaxID=1295 RepID=A0ABX0G118_STASC|nr:DNA polymerase III subunit delta' C-terminal domain-containing protein [Staphylococcus schleiferi]QGS46716.1 DNA polymerase III subunit delta' [Mammaliicoccus fleurettii]MBF1993978.1 DNA polymerase III subunit delta' [Staphylococcus schleiferi]MBF2039582.1 DNA polymerase III subunit delta' [Staphylococcus schleiferi]MBF2101550.1 DNA polymerase III subunit delta' [Staphylococcus schleiferi]MBF2103688.1 DNA polymerase III subunit delta' [Staphylococcus schleiferi]